jgi:hypothetical protein
MSTEVPPTLFMPPWHGQDIFISLSTTHYWKTIQAILTELSQSQLQKGQERTGLVPSH